MAHIDRTALICHLQWTFLGFTIVGVILLAGMWPYGETVFSTPGRNNFIVYLVAAFVTITSGLHAAVLYVVLRRGGIWKSFVEIMEYSYYFLAFTGLLMVAAETTGDRNTYLYSYYSELGQKKLEAQVQAPLRDACANLKFARPLCEWYQAALEAVESKSIEDDRRVLKGLNRDWGYSYWIGNVWYPQRDRESGQMLSNAYEPAIAEISSLLWNRTTADMYQNSLDSKVLAERGRKERVLLWPFFAAIALSLKLTKVSISAFGLVS